MSHWTLTFNRLADHHPAAALWPYILPQVTGALQWLRTLGIKRGSRLGLAGGNTPATAAILLAAPLAGATTVLFNRRLTREELLSQRQRAAIDCLVAEYGHPLAAHAISIPPTFAQGLLTDVTPLAENDPAFILYTSGTSGLAKASRLNWSAIRHAADTATKVLGLHADNSWLGCLPLDHIGGASIIMRAGRCGNSVKLCERFDTKVVNTLLDSQPFHGISVVPTMLMRLLHERGERRWPTHLRYLLTGGGPLAAETIQRSTTLGLPPHQTYGLTEAASQVTTLLPTQAHAHPGSAGQPLPGTDLRVQDGVIEIRSPSLFAGYEEYGQLTETHAANDWFNTGDIGELDADGFLTVHARRSDLIISGGENVYPAAVEAILETHPHITEAGVYGIDDKEWGQVVVAVIVTDTQFNAAECATWCQQHLAAHQRPKQFQQCKTLPRTATGKLQRHMLKNWG